MALLSKKIIVNSIDPSTFSDKELRLIEKETESIEPQEKPKLPDSQLEILKYIYKENLTGIKPAYGDLRQELDLSKPTVKKRIDELISSDHIIEHQKGRKKLLELTEKGRNIFRK
jgi:DNA-binding MarR family transcriptional regulator